MILPLVFAIACTLAALGWPRGALAWLVVTLATLGLMLVLKMAAFACGPPALRSPSGHTAAAAVVLGGLAVVLGRGRRLSSVLLAAGFGAVLIGLSRLMLHVHTAPEVLAGGAVGVLGALVLAHVAGSPPVGVRLGWLAAIVLLVVVAMHGFRLNAERRIDRAAFLSARLLDVCRGEPPLLSPAHLRMLRHPFEL